MWFWHGNRLGHPNTVIEIVGRDCREDSFGGIDLRFAAKGRVEVTLRNHKGLMISKAKTIATSTTRVGINGQPRHVGNKKGLDAEQSIRLHELVDDLVNIDDGGRFATIVKDGDNTN